MTETVGVDAATTDLPRLDSRVDAGEEITLSRNGRPVARLVPFTSTVPNRVPDVWKSRMNITGGFDTFSHADSGEWYSI